MHFSQNIYISKNLCFSDCFETKLGFNDLHYHSVPLSFLELGLQ